MKTFSTLIAFAFLTRAAFAGEWTNISDSVVAQVKPGTYGPTAGVVVDRTNGGVFMVVSDQGLWRSSDHGRTFERCDGKTVGGRCETGWALQADPAGRRLACFMIYGDSAVTADGGVTWTKLKSSRFDFGAVDWGGHRQTAASPSSRERWSVGHERGRGRNVDGPGQRL